MTPYTFPGWLKALRRSGLTLPLSFAIHGAVWHVRPPGSVTGTADGTSWATALSGLEAAAAMAQPGDDIRMTGGVYTNHTVLPSGVAITGGFAGTEGIGTEPALPLERTVLHGGDSGTVLVVMPGIETPTRLRNLTLTHGNGHVGPALGGGLAATNVWLVLENCRLEDNRSAPPLAAALDLQGGRLELRNVVFFRNGGVLTQPAQQQGAVRATAALVQADHCFWFYNNAELTGIGLLENCEGFLEDSRQVANQAQTSQRDKGIASLSVMGGSVRLHRNSFINNGGWVSGVIRLGAGTTGDVANNVFAGNSTGFPEPVSPSATLLADTNAVVRIRHNTFANSGSPAAVVARNADTVVANNLFAGGFQGVFAVPGVTLANNGFWNLQETNVTGGAQDVGSVSAAPRFTGQSRRGEPHLAADSPFREAGAVEYAADLATDWLGQPRVHGSAPDVGAFEIHDPLRLPVPSVIHVAPDGDNRQDGRSWGSAKRDVQAAVETALLDFSEVWFRKGTYAGRFLVFAGVDLYGGFEGTETLREQRDWRKNRPVLDGERKGRVLEMAGSLSNVVDGLVVRGGFSPWGGAGLYGNGDIQIRHSRFEQNEVVITNRSVGSFSGYGGGAISLNFPSHAGIEGNAFVANRVTYKQGGGIFGSGTGGGALWAGQEFNSASASLRLANNLFSANQIVLGASVSISGSLGPAVWARNVAIQLVNNSFVGNQLLTPSPIAFPAAHPAVTISGPNPASPVEASVFNNLFARNDRALALGGTTVNSLVRSNLFFGSKYPSLDEPWRGSNVFADPRLSLTAPGWRLRPDSPARDAGDDTAVVGTEDLLGNPRVHPARVDIGATESDGTEPAAPLKRLFVKPDGDDRLDGLTWSTALRTLTNTVDQARGELTEIWVQAGVYREKLELPGGVSLLGGFVGSETQLAQRNWVANESALDGTGLAVGSLIRLPSQAFPGRVSGFTLRNSSAAQGGAIYCANDSVIELNRLLANNAITPGGGSTAESSQGAAIYVAPDARPLIMNNLVVSNGVSSFQRGSIYIDSGAEPIILTTPCSAPGRAPQSCSTPTAPGWRRST